MAWVTSAGAHRPGARAAARRLHHHLSSPGTGSSSSTSRSASSASSWRQRYIDPIKSDDIEPFDFKGFILAGLGLGGIAFGLSVAGLTISAVAASSSRFIVVRRDLDGRLSCCTTGACRPRCSISALLRLPTLRAGVVGGFMFRLGIGALPFLLPLLLQLGFGLYAVPIGH